MGKSFIYCSPDLLKKNINRYIYIYIYIYIYVSFALLDGLNLISISIFSSFMDCM